MDTRISSRAKKDCPHLETTVTVTAGIRRVACRACGHISVEYQGNGVGEHTVMTASGVISRKS